MFTLEPLITDLNVRERNILKIFFSMNIHKVATPEMMLEDARSYVVFFRESKGKFSAYIALHLLSTNRKLYYKYDDNPFLDDQADVAEEEATAFAESLGAMLDEIDFAKLSDLEQDRWLNEQEIFSQITLPESTPPEKTATPQQIVPLVSIEQPAPTAPDEVQPSATPLQSRQPVSPPPAPSIEVVPEISSPLQQPPRIQLAKPTKPVVTAQPLVHMTLDHQQAVSSIQQQKIQQKQPPIKRQQEDIMLEAIKAGVAKPPKQLGSKEPQQTATVCVKRDKEALARLLTSF